MGPVMGLWGMRSFRPPNIEFSLLLWRFWERGLYALVSCKITCMCVSTLMV